MGVKSFPVKGISARAGRAKVDPTVAVEQALLALPATWAEPTPAKAAVIDRPFWIVLVFQLRAQKLEFLRLAGLDEGADVHQAGAEFAARLAGVAAAAPKALPRRFDVPRLAPAAEPELEEPKAKSGYQLRAAAEAKRFAEATDSMYWIAFCSADATVRDVVAGQLAVVRHAGHAFDGPAVARLLGITLTTPTPAWKAPPVRRRWLALVRP